MYSTTQGSSHDGFPDDELRRLLRRLARTSGLLEPHEHAGLRVSLSEIFALGELSDSGALSQRDLGKRLGLEKSTVSRLAAAMERRGWLTRERDPANRRFYRLRLTAPGEATAKAVGEHFRSLHAHLFDALTPAERAGLELGLAGLVRVFESHANDPRSPG